MDEYLDTYYHWLPSLTEEEKDVLAKLDKKGS